MSHNKDEQAKEQKRAQEIADERRVDDLINLVERKTRTERHLEQHSDVGDPDRLIRPQELQDIREEQIDDIKDALVYGNKVNNNTEHQLENLKKNYEYTNGYIDHNAEHMSEEDLSRVKEKQRNRKEQIDQME